MLGIIKLKVVMKGGTADFAFGPISSWVSPFLFNAMAQDSWTCFLSPARFNIGEEISTKNWDTIFFFLLWPIYLSESIYFMKSEFNGKFIPFLRRGNVFLAKMFIF